MIHTNSKINVSVNDTTKGRITGRRERLAGTTGTIRAIPNHRYSFKHWEDALGNIISTDDKLVITNWSAGDYHAVFENIVLTYQDFVNQDAVETLVYFLEQHGLHSEVPYSYGRNYDLNNLSYFSAGNYPSGPAVRSLRNGGTVNTYPSTYGFNYLVPNPNEYLLGQGTYNATTGIVDGEFVRSPDTTDALPASGIDVTRLAPWSGRTEMYAPRMGHRGGALGDGSGTQDWNIPFLGVYNNPQSGPPEHFPYLKYSAIKHWEIRADVPEPPDLTGLEELDAWGCASWTEHRSHTPYHTNDHKGIWNMDATAYWNDLIYYSIQAGHYAYSGWKGSNAGAQGTNNENVRYIEAVNYNYNLRYWDLPSGEYGPREKHPDKNSGWVSKYQNVPQSGSYFNLFRNTPVRRLRIRQYGSPSSGRALNHYYKSLSMLYLYSPWAIYNGTRETQIEQPWLLKSCKNLQRMFIYDHSSKFRVSNLDFISNIPACRQLELHGTTTGPLMYLTGGRGHTNLERIVLPGNTWQSYNPYPYEPVLICANLDGSTLPANDQSRHNHSITNYGGTFTDT
jgi:hypothetical protein